MISRADGAFVTTQKFDQFGHLASDQQGDTLTQHLTPVISGNLTYEATSNPQFASGGDATAGWTRITRDTMGRPVRTDYFDGASLPQPWGSNTTSTAFSSTHYDGYSATITDESGKVRQQTADGVGRLNTVVEDPGAQPTFLSYSTSYLYDANDNLIVVCQNGTLSGGSCPTGLGRGFGYSSLNRLIGANNPETGTMNYTYDNSGNLLTKIDARQFKTTYAFDDLNRLRSKTYSDGTATATQCYGDDAANHSVSRGAGANLLTVSWSCSTAPTGGFTEERLTLASGDASQTTYSYDALGRIVGSQQTTNSLPYGFSFTRNANGSLGGASLPSGRSLTWTYDNSGRPTVVSETFQSVTTSYAGSSQGTKYWPNGTLQALPLASGTMTFSESLDTRLRPTSLSLTTPITTETLGYTWNSNGNPATETITNPLNPTALTQTFTYDGVNRVIKASESNGSTETWNQKYGYDEYGNRSLLTSSNFNPYSGVTPQTADPPVLGQTVHGPFTNNRFNSAQPDAAGNIIGGAATMTTFGIATYDAENRLLTVHDGSSYMRYYYDGEGRRVMKAVCSSTQCTTTTSGVQVTTFVYDAEGQLTAEYGPAGPVTGTQYVFADHLGSTRALVTSTGAFTKCYDYTPFGLELPTSTGGRANCYTDVGYPSANQEAESIKFTGKERDAETGLDFFYARYFSSAQGRFTSPDAPFADQNSSDPQSWNLYAYVRNNPLAAIDPNGQECVTLDGGGVGDDGKGNFCQDKSLQTTHGVTVNGTTNEVTPAVFGNAVLMGDVDLSGRKDRINDASEEILNLIPAAKTAFLFGKAGFALGPLAVVIAKNRLEHVLARHAANTLAQNVSKFAANLGKQEIEGLINTALSDTKTVITPGAKVTFYDLDLGTQIGTNQAGQATTTIRVLVDNATKDPITAYPK